MSAKQTVAQLKAECKQRGLPSTGLKAVLIARIVSDEKRKSEEVIGEEIEGPPNAKWLKLPEELIQTEVIKHLSIIDLLALDRLSKRFRAYVRNEGFLRQYFADSDLTSKHSLLEFVARIGNRSLFNELGKTVNYSRCTQTRCSLYWAEQGWMNASAMFIRSDDEEETPKLPISNTAFHGLRELAENVKKCRWVIVNAAVAELVLPFQYDEIYLGNLLLRLMSMEDLRALGNVATKEMRCRVLLNACLAALLDGESYDKINGLFSTIPRPLARSYNKLLFEYITPYGLKQLPKWVRTPVAPERVRSPILFNELLATTNRIKLRNYHLVLTPEEAETLFETDKHITWVRYRKYREKTYIKFAIRDGYDLWAKEVTRLREVKRQ